MLDYCFRCLIRQARRPREREKVREANEIDEWVPAFHGHTKDERGGQRGQRTRSNVRRGEAEAWPNTHHTQPGGPPHKHVYDQQPAAPWDHSDSDARVSQAYQGNHLGHGTNHPNHPSFRTGPGGVHDPCFSTQGQRSANHQQHLSQSRAATGVSTGPGGGAGRAQGAPSFQQRPAAPFHTPGQPLGSSSRPSTPPRVAFPCPP